MKRLKYLDSLGFTLIELLLTVALISSIAAISYSGFQIFNKNKDLGLAEADFANSMNEARSYTLTQAYTLSCKNVNRTFMGFRILVNNSIKPNRYSIQLDCLDSATGHVYSTINTKILPSSVTIAIQQVTYGDGSDPDHNTILSNVAGNAFLFNAPNATLDASIAATFTSHKSVGVGIDENGVVHECDENCQSQ